VGFCQEFRCLPGRGQVLNSETDYFVLNSIFVPPVIVVTVGD